MKRLIFALTTLLAAPASLAAGAGALYSFTPDVGNTASVQRGAANFMNYCSGCHSLQFLRYNRIAADNDIPDDLLGQIMFTSDKPGEHVMSAMPAEQAAQWFGQAPPDLSLTARARGADWIYSFMKTFYLDPSKATGVNNLQLPGASMPHVLGELQGYQQVVHEDEPAQDTGGHGGHAGPKFELVREGQLDPKAYDAFVSDTVNFLAYAAEPGKKDMHALGFKVLLYILFILIPITWLIKREFWKDVH